MADQVENPKMTLAVFYRNEFQEIEFELKGKELNLYVPVLKQISEGAKFEDVDVTNNQWTIMAGGIGVRTEKGYDMHTFLSTLKGRRCKGKALMMWGASQPPSKDLNLSQLGKFKYNEVLGIVTSPLEITQTPPNTGEYAISVGTNFCVSEYQDPSEILPGSWLAKTLGKNNSAQQSRRSF